MQCMNTRKYTTIKSAIIFLFIATLTSCTSTYYQEFYRAETEKLKSLPEESAPDMEEEVLNTKEDLKKYTRLTKKQKKIVEAALNSCYMKYSDTLKFKNKKFVNDCSGLIYGIFWESDIDLIAEASKEKGSGVKRVYNVLNKKSLIHKQKLPNPGDIIFWNNTYGSWGNKPLSHIGVVVSVDNDGNIEYVHNNTFIGAIKKESMNLYRPQEKSPVNSYMRYDSSYKKTAGELFDSFGMAWKL